MFFFFRAELAEAKKRAKTYKERKKHDRFDGMPEEEVSKRVLPDHLTNNLDIIIVSLRIRNYSVLVLTFGKYDDKRRSPSFIHALAFIYHTSILRHRVTCKFPGTFYRPCMSAVITLRYIERASGRERERTIIACGEI